jgi:hypothetical protein
VFVVPKLLPDGRRNTVRCVSLEHKLGIHASPTCVLSFEDAEGELVGPEHGGMRAMFSMMNPARLAIAVQGLAIGERSWQQAHAYAQVRRQGRDPRTRSGPVALVEHPDVRRMLADLRSTTRALRLLLYTTAAEAEAAEAAQVDGDGGGKAVSPARRRVDVLTPIVKAWCTDEGVRLASLALQVHGGAGYVEETGIAQRLRDSRIAPIYEGTNGIQAIDLVQRKVLPDGGAALLALLDDLAAGAPVGQGELAAASDAVRAGLAEVRTTTEWLAGTNAAADGPDDVLAGATPYLELVATVAAGALLASYAATAVTSAWPEAHELVEDARFFATHRLRPALGLGPVVRAGSEPLPRFP